jgi:cyclopropane fatty-acyl-phospholipid synthase-like methyltransferase
MREGHTVLDVGSGFGGPSRWIAFKTSAQVTAVELQPHIDSYARVLTERTGLSHHVEHICADIFDLQIKDQSFDHAFSFLSFLHIPEHKTLFRILNRSLTSQGSLFIEDYIRLRDLTHQESFLLREKVQCSYLPTHEEYIQNLIDVDFVIESVEEMSVSWKGFTAERLSLYRERREISVALHGDSIVSGLDDFYATVAELFASGAIGGLRVLAKTR